MSNQDGYNPQIGEELIAAGWRQGKLFTAPSISFAWNDAADPTAGASTALQSRPVKNKEKLVLISQDCDIKASENDEPYVEAMICKVVRNESYLANLERRSARYFVVDPQVGLVAQAKYRIEVSKKVLRTIKPEPWPSDAKRLERFVEWLARRYDRPGIPDELVDVFQTPVTQKLDELSDSYPDVMRAFSRAVHDLRINVPQSEHPPFELYIVGLFRDEELSQEEADALDLVEEAIRNCIDPGVIHLGTPTVEWRTEAQMSLEEYLKTRPLYLEYLTYRGDEIEGLEPYPRV